MEGENPDVNEVEYEYADDALEEAQRLLAIQEYEKKLDLLLLRIHDSLDDNNGILWEPRHSKHSGHDNALNFTNEWIVHIPNGDEHANMVAREAGYVNLGPVKGFHRVYHMRRADQPSIHKRNARELTQQLVDDERVTWADQQFLKERRKRTTDIDEETVLGSEPVDMKPKKSLTDDLAGLFNHFRVGSLLHHVSPVLNPNDEKFNDILWDKEWYLQDTRTRTSLPRLDLNVLPVFDMGITGKGVNVVILDDGIEHNHTDLIDNYNPSISFDLNDNDDDPMPHYGATPSNSHGTRCAGEIAMKANNSKCGVGIAFNVQIGGIRMLDGPVSDRVEGEALIYALDKVDIFSASWGPSDNGEVVEGPGRLAQLAFMKGVTHGRQGKGVNYVWASGNGGANDDTCSCDGYASSIFTLSIGSASESGSFPWYGEKCASTMAVTYSSGAYTDQKIATTDIDNSCTTGHTGTSASAPLAAGIVALTLEANPKLTWRDIQHLVVWTSQPEPLKNNVGWKSNKIGLEFNQRFGFGLMDAHQMVVVGKNWTNVPAQKICRVKSLPIENNNIYPTDSNIIQFQTDGCKGSANEVNVLEHVEVVVTIHYSRRGDLQIELTSPMGTSTELLFPRKNDAAATGFNDWPFMSVHTWGEKPQGRWTMKISDSAHDLDNEGFIKSATMILYGTKTVPAHMQAGPKQYPDEYKRRTERKEPSQESEEPPRAKTPVERLNSFIDNLHLDDIL
jgi:proprotein convertase subtilisin/kexin type 1